MFAELASYWQKIEDLNRRVDELIVDLPTEALNWRPIGGVEGGTNSLAVLAIHIAGAAHFWVGEVVGGLPPTRDRDAEFVAQAADASELVRLLKETGAEAWEVLSRLSEADLDGMRQARGRTFDVRWCILHVIEHTALHLGQMQITYQLWKEGQDN